MRRPRGGAGAAAAEARGQDLPGAARLRDQGGGSRPAAALFGRHHNRAAGPADRRAPRRRSGERALRSHGQDGVDAVALRKASLQLAVRSGGQRAGGIAPPGSPGACATAQHSPSATRQPGAATSSSRRPRPGTGLASYPRPAETFLGAACLDAAHLDALSRDPPTAAAADRRCRGAALSARLAAGLAWCRAELAPEAFVTRGPAVRDPRLTVDRTAGVACAAGRMATSAPGSRPAGAGSASRPSVIGDRSSPARRSIGCWSAASSNPESHRRGRPPRDPFHGSTARPLMQRSTATRPIPGRAERRDRERSASRHRGSAPPRHARGPGRRDGGRSRASPRRRAGPGRAAPFAA